MRAKFCGRVKGTDVLLRGIVRQTPEKIAIFIFAAIILYSMVVRVQLYMLGISLWYDESLLALNIVPRTLSELLTPPLAAMQSAPVGYLMVVKGITAIFGASEATLRSYSFAALIAMLLCVWRLLKSVFKLSDVFVWFCLALTASFPLYVRYTNELKPYMGDACIAFLILVLYLMYREKRLPIFALAPIYAVLLLLSSPSIFFIASVLMIEFLRLLFRKNYRSALLLALAALIPVAVFILNYMYWLRSTDGMMFYWWERYRFLLPLSREAISADLRLFREFLYPFGNWSALLLALSGAGFLVSLLKKNIYTWILFISFGLLLVASNLGMYPVISRLWLFFYGFIFIYTALLLDQLRVFAGGIQDHLVQKRQLPTLLVCSVLCVALLAGNFGFPRYAKGEADTLIPGMQINPLIDYVRENIRDGEKLYCFETASAALGFKNGYGRDRIGNVAEDNIIWGAGAFQQIYMPIAEDAALIEDAKYAYVLFYRGYLPDSIDDRMPELTGLLSEQGYIDKVLDINYTPLYWFSKDLAHLKTSALLEKVDYQGELPENSMVVRIENTGQTILEADGVVQEGAIPFVSGAVRTVVRAYKDGVLFSETLDAGLEAPLLPGASVDLLVALPPGDTVDQVEIDLVSEGRFSFSEIGMSPIILRASR